MSSFSELLERLVAALEASKVPFMVAGSFASTTHGLPRTTQDLDLVIDPPDRAALDRLLNQFSPEHYYFDRQAAHDAFNRRSMFNLIDQSSGWKVDLIIRKNRPFSRAEFDRRIRITLFEVELQVASAEDTVVAKLEWSQQSGGSERQRRDVAGILATAKDQLDRPYIERWVATLGLEAEWEAAQRSDL